MADKIWLSSPHMGGTEKNYVDEAFATNWVAPLGPNVDGFEKDLCAYTGAAEAAALSSGTAALHLALIMLGVGAGDEVICQSFTFSASANPIAYQGATPIFVDSEPDTWNMCPLHLQAAIKDRIQKGKKPKAIIPVHLYGMPAKMDEIMAVAQAYEIPIVEDAAEALGASLNKKACGTFGKMGILSFNGNKIITTSGGGAIIANDMSLVARARFLATQSRDAAPHYQHSQIGYNYRMSNICAGIGRGQMEVLNQRVQQRRANFDWYVAQFGQLPGISFLKEPTGVYSNRWLTCVLIDSKQTRNGVDREDVRLAMEKENIECRPLWKPMHLQPVFENCPYYGDDLAESLFINGLCLPSGSNLSTDDLMRLKAVFDAVL
jgi:dTDP-4-amino-4,6-dideoxygalactose transaminase